MTIRKVIEALLEVKERTGEELFLIDENGLASALVSSQLVKQLTVLEALAEALKNKRKNQETDDGLFNFISIYELYPLKKGKEAGLKILRRTIKTLPDYQKLQLAVSNYSKEVEGREPRYIKNFDNFCKIWRDFISEEQTNKNIGIIDPRNF